jgi:hypothetical protein
VRQEEFSHPEDLREDSSRREGTTGMNESSTVRKKSSKFLLVRRCSELFLRGGEQSPSSNQVSGFPRPNRSRKKLFADIILLGIAMILYLYRYELTQERMYTILYHGTREGSYDGFSESVVSNAG